jgi:hypothetical protein
MRETIKNNILGVDISAPESLSHRNISKRAIAVSEQCLSAIHLENEPFK